MNGKPYHYIDKDIRYLVACMNAHEFRPTHPVRVRVTG